MDHWYHDEPFLDSWNFSNLPRLKHVSLSCSNEIQENNPPVDAELLLNILASSASETQSNEADLDLHAGKQLQQGFQLETLTLEDHSLRNDRPSNSTAAAINLRSILHKNCINLTAANLSLPLLTAHHLNDIADFCPSLKDLTIGKSDNIVHLTVELFLQRMSGRLKRFCVHRMACYEKNTCFSLAWDACSSLSETCRALGIELKLGTGKKKGFLTPNQIASMSRSNSVL